MSKDDVLESMRLDAEPMSEAVHLVTHAEFKTKTIHQIKGTGYVVESLEAALWCFWQTDTYQDCVLQAANLGDDADTTAAIAGQLAGGLLFIALHHFESHPTFGMVGVNGYLPSVLLCAAMALRGFD